MKTKEWIEENYLNGKMSFFELMQELELTKSSTYRMLKKMGIVKRKTKSKTDISKEILERLYVKELLSIEEIAEKFKVSKDTIKDKCSIFGLKRGWSYLKTESYKDKCFPTHTNDSKSKMSAAKLKEGTHYVRGKFGSSDRRYVHRRIAEESIGRKLGANEVVHHKDQNRQNNHPENLIVLEREAHQALHIVLRKRLLLNQELWLRENLFEFYEVINGNYQNSETFERWYGHESCISAMGQN